MRPSQLRKRTDNIEGYIENWLDHYDIACGLEQAGQLLKTAIIQMGQLQDKVNNQAKVIQDMQERKKRVAGELTEVDVIELGDRFGKGVEDIVRDMVPRWIPCEERLPEKDGDYLVSLVNCRVKILGYTTKNKDKYSKGFYLLTSDLFALPPVDPVLAWMPLPEPYNGERKDNE